MSVISGKFNIMNPCQSKVLNTAFTQVTHSNLTIRGILLCVCVCFKSSGRVAFDIWVLLVHLSSKMVFWHFSSRLQSSQWEKLILTGSPETDTSQRWMLWTHTRAVAGSQPQSPLLRLMQGHIFSLGNNWWGQFSKTQKHSRLPIAFGWQSLLHSGKPRSKIDSVGPLGWRHSKWSMKAMDWIVKTDCKLPLRLSLKSSYVFCNCYWAHGAVLEPTLSQDFPCGERSTLSWEKEENCTSQMSPPWQGPMSSTVALAQVSELKD